MKLVETIANIEKNIKTLERDRRKNSNLESEYIRLIQNGNCYLPYLNGDVLSFIPSRFIGYIDNNLSIHTENIERHGGRTNQAISKILSLNPIPNEFLEEKFQEFCKSQNAIPSIKPRKFWITQEIKNLIEDDEIDKIKNNPKIKATEKEQLIKARIGQGNFRKSLIDLWGQCCISHTNLIQVLRASHIKPWKDCNNEERLNKFNGLLLTPNFDVLFDCGLISFSDKGSILISKLLSNDQCKILGIHRKIKIKIEKEHLEFMKWHRDIKFYKKNNT
ncbi:HNH endonuclease [Acinetobacter sp. RIT698]|uniref:HNH endonuclease n=1 Tax=Acinetobacter sp. RIT698 TaxID=2666192 RepID=UPI0012ACE2C9|nr:HNH endonuclease [Acinetobacter sp. RIT698]MRT38763.1 HNH endonuclease [Acinetobacter sp. RIT698]